MKSAPWLPTPWAATTLAGMTLALTVCSSEGDSPFEPALPSAGSPVPGLAEAAHLYSAYYSGLKDSLRLIVSDGATWAGIWDQMQAPVSPPPQLPAIDFDQEMVLVTALGERTTGGYAITIDSLSTGRGILVVYLSKRSPGSRCVVTQALSQPVDVVRAPRQSGPVVFDESTGTEDCS